MAEEKKIVYNIEVKSNAEAGLNKLDSSAKNTSASLQKTGKSAKDTGKEVSGMGKHTEIAGGLLSKMGGSIGKIPGLLTTAIVAVKAFGKALLTNPIGLIIGAFVMLIGIIGKVLSKFQPFIDFIADKFSFLHGLMSGFTNSLQKMGSVFAAVFTLHFGKAIKLLGGMASQTIDAAKAAEEYTKVMREQAVQAKLNDATTARSTAHQNELQAIMRDQTKTIQERSDAMKEYYTEAAAEAKDDANVSAEQLRVIRNKIAGDKGLRASSLKTAEDIAQARNDGKIDEEQYTELIEATTKAFNDEGKEAEVAAKKQRELAKIALKNLSLQLKVLRQLVALNKAADISLLEGKMHINAKLVEEDAKRIDKIAAQQKAAAKAEFDIAIKTYGEKSQEATAAALKFATDVLNINADVNKQKAKNDKALNKEIIKTGNEALALYKEQNAEELKDMVITSDAELKERVKLHSEELKKTEALLKKKARIEQWSNTKLKTELLKSEGEYNAKVKQLEDNLAKNKEGENKKVVEATKAKIKLLEDLEKGFVASSVYNDEEILANKKKAAEKEYQNNLDKINKLELSEQEAADAKKLAYDTYLNEKAAADLEYDTKKKDLDDAARTAKEKLDADAKATADANNEALLANITNTISQIQAISNMAMEYNNTIRDTELEKIKNRYQTEEDYANNKYEKESKRLKKQLENGIISQKKYDDKIFALNENFENSNKILQDTKATEERNAKKKAFEDNKKFQIANVIMNSASGVMAAWNTTIPAPFGQILAGIETALIVGLGVAQIDKINATKFASGGKLFGDLHAQASGGIPLTSNVMAEGGEYVVNRASTTQYEPVLNAINDAGNANGDKSSVSDIIDYDKLASLINKQRVYVVSSDITEQQDEDARIVEIASA